MITAAAVLPAAAQPAFPLDYPTRPVKLVIGFAPGGPADILARVLGQYLSERLGQPFVIENRPGAGTTIATETVARSAPDGYTLLWTTSADEINATLYRKLNYNFIRDIVPVASIDLLPLVMEVTPGFPATSVAEFIAYAKANPGKINFASGGVGSSQHVAGELFDFMTGIKMVHVPYRGAVLAVNDLLAGQVQVTFSPIPLSLGYIRAGKLRALAVTSAARSGVAGCSDRGRLRARLRGGCHRRTWSSRRHARTDRRQAQPDGQRRVGRSASQGAAANAGQRAESDVVRRIRQVHRRRNRQVGKGRQVCEYHGRMNR